MRIDHVAMYVNDLENAKEFFVRFFNARVNADYHNKLTDFCSYFLTFENGTKLELMNKPNLLNLNKQESQTGYIHLAFGVGSKEKVDDLTEKMRNGGYQVLSGPRITGDGYYESCVVGVEGNLIEITI